MRLNLLYLLYFICLLLLAPINLLSFDTYYYWEWSRHLALSYYDGSPMIAYFIKLSTYLFGDTLFALSLIGIIVMALISWIIYKTARLFLSIKASHIATSLWLFSPLATMDLLKQTTYDTPLMLFWALVLYLVIKYIACTSPDNTKIPPNTTGLYYIGAGIGLMMLSKYSGIVLILSLLIFLITTQYRYLLKIYQFYLALLLAVIIFSPVIIWNYQHEWQSFTYQLKIHQLNKTSSSLVNVIHTFFYTILPSLNVMLIPLILCRLKKTIPIVEKDRLIVRLCQIVSITLIGFYLFTASKANIRAYWLTPYLISSSLLGGFCYQTFSYRKSSLALHPQRLNFWQNLGKQDEKVYIQHITETKRTYNKTTNLITKSVLVLYGVISLSMMINNTYQFTPMRIPEKLIYYHLMQEFNATYLKLPSIVLTSGWFEARMLFFLKNKASVYTLNCGSAQNQYALWSVGINQKIANRTINQALYIDKYNKINCLKKYFDYCKRLPVPTETYKHKDYTIYAYFCKNLIRNGKDYEPRE